MKRFTQLIALVLSGSLFSSQGLRAQQVSDQDPLGDIAADMTFVRRSLSRLTTGKPTQKTQKIVVKKLDDLIARLEKECAACRGGGASGANPTRPLADSVIVGGPGGIGDLHAPRTGDKKWGQLPPHQRDRILQSLTEGFPAHYQRILERYYRRLAEEKPASELEEPRNSKSNSAPTAAAKKKDAALQRIPAPAKNGRRK